ncbi:tRNA-dihydrouridine synthase family protein [Desulfovibrio aerotolerans]|uniref:tRNA-dihydrouridine synthase n=1 Tax=Solidesulfovibrio aerotolerans TaxID=295255 RepID=A0A7C9N413_9BACT|nr:tRNA-dihydrouridine synthase family protein [Solidesulfovibrio aerotolerans]MYL82095.1 tRNA-dihydrouridine synthase family protein [Solidesulfovibrio aerotolerans]
MSHLPIAPDAPWLAPLAGFSDLPFRLLCRELGAAVAVTEMVSAKGLFYDSRNTRRLLDTCPADSPLVVQLFGAEPDPLARAAASLAGTGYTYFDLNCGCSVRKVVKTRAGAALLSAPDRLVACAAAMVQVAGPGRVGVKLRLGPKPPARVDLEVAGRLAEAGVAWLTLHPRYASQGFAGVADHDALAAFVAASPVPVLASGDLMSAADGQRVLAHTGASGVMYARGAMADPRIFAHHAARYPGAAALPGPVPPVCEVIRRHAALCREYADDRQALLRMRTAVPRYLRDLPGCRALRARLCRVDSWEELGQIIDEAEGLSHAPTPVAGEMS